MKCFLAMNVAVCAREPGIGISAMTVRELRQAIIRIEPERPAAPRFVSLSAAGADPIGPV
jgi:hypothetical protein